jgi:uncharacterized protein YceK
MQNIVIVLLIISFIFLSGCIGGTNSSNGTSSAPPSPAGVEVQVVTSETPSALSTVTVAEVQVVTSEIPSTLSTDSKGEMSVATNDTSSQLSTDSGAVLIIAGGDRTYNWGEDIKFSGIDTNGKTVTFTSTFKNTGESRSLGSFSVDMDNNWGTSISTKLVTKNHIPGVYEIKAQDGKAWSTVDIIIQ